jgi:hypothetical protein
VLLGDDDGLLAGAQAGAAVVDGDAGRLLGVDGEL